MAAIVNGQKGLYIKKKTDAAPVFVSFGDANTPDDVIQKNATQFISQINASGAGVDWSGDNPAEFDISNATGDVKLNTPASPGVGLVEDTYFDVMLKNIEKSGKVQEDQAQRSYDAFIANLKENRQLFNENMARTYGQALQKVNINAYDRGLGASGVKDENLRDTTVTKDFQVKTRDVEDRQRQEEAQRQFEDSRALRQLAQERTRASLKSPYATYEY